MIPVEFRLIDKIDFTRSACWEWTAGKDRDGYGRIGLNRGSVRAYWLLYDLLIGPVPEGLELDHLCRNRACVNPAHLEPVTHAENILRGDSPQAQNARKTHCKHGHEFTPENTYIRTNGRRDCRKCTAIRQAAYQRRLAERKGARV